ncbi:MAG: flavodoxin domain-containing protein [Fermentimonas sp.]|jgi:menaquinone-dependent protoporphyrinogen oxidase
MMSNTLIVYAFRHETEEQSVKRLFKLLDGKVDICNIYLRRSTPDLDKYETIIIGGSVRYDDIQREIYRFCEDNLDELLTKRIGLFVSFLYPGNKGDEQIESSFPKALTDVAIAKECFGEAINEKELNFWERFITKYFIKKEELAVKLSEEKIDRFAREISGCDDCEGKNSAD